MVARYYFSICSKSVNPLASEAGAEVELEQPTNIIHIVKERTIPTKSLVFEKNDFIYIPPIHKIFYLSANAGSSFAAFNAGNSPPSKATVTDATTATTAEKNG